MTKKPPASDLSQETDHKPAPEKSVDDFAHFMSLIANFWKKWRFGIVGVLGLVGLAIVSVKVYAFVQHKKELSIQASFQDATDEEKKLAFAEQYPKASQTGVIYLQIADGYYEANEYDQAALYYQKAESLLTVPFKGRALLGQAMALLQSEKEDSARQGRALLQAIIQNNALFDVARAQAAYNQALLHLKEEQFSAVKEQIDFIENLENAGFFWLQKARDLFRELPPLADLADSIEVNSN